MVVIVFVTVSVRGADLTADFAAAVQRQSVDVCVGFPRANRGDDLGKFTRKD